MRTERPVNFVEQTKREFFNRGYRFTCSLLGDSRRSQALVLEAFELIYLEQPEFIRKTVDFSLKENKLKLFKNIYAILKTNKFKDGGTDFTKRWHLFYQLDFQERVIFYLKFRLDL